MKGIITINVNDHKVDFDFENYTYGISFNIEDKEKDRLKIIEEIEQDSDYKLLRKCLISKHDYNNIPDSDPKKYRKALDEFTDWCMERQERQERQSGRTS